MACRLQSLRNRNGQYTHKCGLADCEGEFENLLDVSGIVYNKIGDDTYVIDALGFKLLLDRCDEVIRNEEDCDLADAIDNFCEGSDAIKMLRVRFNDAHVDENNKVVLSWNDDPVELKEE